MGLPLLLTSQGIAATFSSPGGNGYSLQSDRTTGFKLSQFSGLYLSPNSVTSIPLEIQFSQAVGGISLTFATADFQQVEVPTTVQLTALATSTGATVGSTTARGAYSGDTMPTGTLSFTSGVPFDVVRLEIPSQVVPASGFLVDNIVVTPAAAPQRSRGIRRHLIRLGP